MIFLFYNQLGQVIDEIELVEGAILRTLPTDYDLPGWSRFHISWNTARVQYSSNPLCRARCWKVTDDQNGCCGRGSPEPVSEERKVTSGKAPYWPCIWPTFFGSPRLASRHVLQPYKRSISTGDHAFSTRFRREADVAAYRSFIRT